MCDICRRLLPGVVNRRFRRRGLPNVGRGFIRPLAWLSRQEGVRKGPLEGEAGHLLKRADTPPNVGTRPEVPAVPRPLPSVGVLSFPAGAVAALREALQLIGGGFTELRRRPNAHRHVGTIGAVQATRLVWPAHRFVVVYLIEHEVGKLTKAQLNRRQLEALPYRNGT
jgi:hypothetical protein